MSRLAAARVRFLRYLSSGWRYLLLSSAVAGAIAAGIKFDLSKSEWAAWVQAVGSIAAILGAVWIATKEDRRRRNELRAAARLTAASLTMRLAGTAACVRQVMDRFTAWHQIDFDPKQISASIEILEHSISVSISELIPLIPIQNNAAYKLAGAFDRLHAAIFALKNFEHSPNAQNSKIRKEFIGPIGLMLSEACSQLDLAVNVLQKESLALTSPYSEK